MNSDCAIVWAGAGGGAEDVDNIAACILVFYSTPQDFARGEEHDEHTVCSGGSERSPGCQRLDRSHQIRFFLYICLLSFSALIGSFIYSLGIKSFSSFSLTLFSYAVEAASRRKRVSIRCFSSVVTTQSQRSVGGVYAV